MSRKKRQLNSILEAHLTGREDLGKDFKKEEENLLHSLHLAAPAAPLAAPPAREVAVGCVLSQPPLVAEERACSSSWLLGSVEPCQASPQFILCQFNKCTT